MARGTVKIVETALDEGRISTGAYIESHLALGRCSCHSEHSCMMHTSVIKMLWRSTYRADLVLTRWTPML